MLQTQAQPRSRQRPSATNADRRFKGYKPEDHRAVREASVEEGAFAQIRDAWIKWKRSTKDLETHDSAEEIYVAAISALNGIQISSKDVERFCVLLIDHQDEKDFNRTVGLFLSALINQSQDTDFTIQTKHLSQTLYNIAYIGYRNTKNIVVEETSLSIVNVGEGMLGGSIHIKANAVSIGKRMKKGNIIVDGWAWSHVGTAMEGGTILVKGSVDNGGGKVASYIGSSMGGGRITIKGSVSGTQVGICMVGGVISVTGNFEGKDIIGCSMEGGEIHIHGNVEEKDPSSWCLGEGMMGGEIHLYGNFGGLSKHLRGKVFHQGVQIWPKASS